MNDKVYIPNKRQGWWGGLDTRPRCLHTDKVAFQTQAHAELQAGKIREREAFKKPRADGKVMNAYQCKACGQWHVGHGKPKAPIQES